MLILLTFQLKSLYQCYYWLNIINHIGITRDLKTKELMLIMTYANGGDLHKYLQKDFTSINWGGKLSILSLVSTG